jgi:hypothetical protein
VTLVQRLHLADQGKMLALSTLDATADAILAEGVATEDEVTAAMASLAQFTADAGTLIGGPRIFQLLSRRQEHHEAR